MESNNMDFQFPTEDVSADLSFSDMQLIPDMDFSQYDATLNAFDTFEYPASSVNESPLTTNYESFAPQAEDFRFLVDSWASTDQRSRSMKQKRRDAAIDLHLQRFANAHSDSQLFPTDSEFSFSDSSQQSPVASTPVSSTSNSERSVPQTGGRELVFDINLNTATNLPKKQKKRTQAQIEDYINARRNGACLKHKKQHKKCNCHEKQSAKVAMDAKRKRKAALSKVAMPTPGLVTTSPSETPSTISRSSFSPSVFSQVDSQSFNEEIDYALASLDETNDMERWANLVSHTSMADPPQQYYQTESHDLSPVRHRNINSADVSTNLQTNVGYLPQQDESFDHLLGLRDGISDGGSRNTGGLVTTGGLAGLTEGTSGLMWNISSGRVHPDPAGASNGQPVGASWNVATTTGRNTYPGPEHFACTARLAKIEHDGTAQYTTTAIHPYPAGATDEQLAGSTGSITGTTRPARTTIGDCCASIRRGPTDSASFKPTTTVIRGSKRTLAPSSGCTFTCCLGTIDTARDASTITGGTLRCSRFRTANNVRRTPSIKLYERNVQRRPTDRLFGYSAILQNFYSLYVHGVLDVRTLCHGFTRHASSCDALSVDLV
ncbi:hypothetical protein TCE0_039f12699 [Talaromyces pinophilus]|uniref:Uncharacterized protein n=1 Tax=Talaromyces pinophilus TaxID=128442 RepID=A0A6N4SKY8_TALPI|nr:hypothetical protein TCE0_039f12699 [Talaromyces pinophilus]